MTWSLATVVNYEGRAYVSPAFGLSTASSETFSVSACSCSRQNKIYTNLFWWFALYCELQRRQKSTFRYYRPRAAINRTSRNHLCHRVHSYTMTRNYTNNVYGRLQTAQQRWSRQNNQAPEIIPLRDPEGFAQQRWSNRTPVIHRYPYQDHRISMELTSSQFQTDALFSVVSSDIIVALRFSDADFHMHMPVNCINWDTRKTNGAIESEIEYKLTKQSTVTFYEALPNHCSDSVVARNLLVRPYTVQVKRVMCLRNHKLQSE